MSIFFGGSPPITMKRTETSRTCFCLLEDIRNRGRSFLVLRALAVVRANRSSKARNEREDRAWPCCHIGSAALSLGQTGGGASLMPNISVYTHNMYTNANMLHSIYIYL